MKYYIKNRISLLIIVDFIDMDILKSGMFKLCEKFNEKNTEYTCSIFKSDFEKIKDSYTMRKFYNEFLNFTNENSEKNIICFIENSWIKNKYSIELFDEFKDLLIGNFDDTILIYGQGYDDNYNKRLKDFKYHKYFVNSESYRDMTETILSVYSKTIERCVL